MEEKLSNQSLIPSNQDRRKVIIVLSRNDFNTLRSKDDNGLRANQSICLVEYDNLVSNYSILDGIKPMIVPGVILLQSPYDRDVYEISEDAMYKFSISKHVIVSQVFRLLGCKYFEAIQLDVQGEKETRQIQIAGKHPELSAEFQSLNIREKSLLSEIKIKEVYEGSEPRIQQAHDYIAKRYLTNDNNLMGLIEKRSDKSNKISEYTLQITLTKETKHTVAFLGSIGMPKFLVSISANVETLKQNISEYKVTYRAKF